MSRKVTLKNSLATVNPKLVEQWNNEKNGSFTPYDVSAGSGKKVWWICENGHEWEAAIFSRNKGNGCPYCNNRIVWEGNSLANIRPDIAKTWHHKKNDNLTPYDVTYGSGKKVWWICEKGHEWKTSVDKRNAGNGCPYCSNKRVSIENSVYYTHPEIIEFWHSEKNNPITPYDVTHGSNKKVWWMCKKGHEWQEKICIISKGDRCPFCSNHRVHEGNSLKYRRPDVANSWHFEKNYPLTPDDVSVHSNKKIWWKCENGHEWKTAVCKRTEGTGCPFCLNKKVSVEKSIHFTHPELISFWNSQKNDPITTLDITYGSNKKVWWICEKGHEWNAPVSAVSKGDRCPYCSNHKVNDENCLQNMNPELSRWWHFEKNFPLTPFDFTCGSNQKVWWKCEKGHEWESSIDHRQAGNGCPYCSNRKVYRSNSDMINTNSLHDTRPDIAATWHFEKNHPLTPSEVVSGSNRKVWWKCEKGHEWEAVIASRKQGSGCPYCSNHTVWEGNSLQTVRPDIADSWNFEKNGTLTPSDVMSGSNQKVWWKCEKGHIWEAVIANRANGSGCPYCINRMIAEENSLAITHPKVALMWDYNKNHPLTPSDFSAGSGKKVWWKCERGHEYLRSINKSTTYKNCPICMNSTQTSFAEQAVYFYLKQLFPETKNRFKFDKKGREIDILIPNLNLAIEYDGHNYHEKRKLKDRKKQIDIEKMGMDFIRILEEHRVKGLIEKEKNALIHSYQRRDSKEFYNELSAVIIKLISFINNKFTDNSTNIKVDVYKDRTMIQGLIEISDKKKSLGYCHPELIPEWHWEKNQGLDPFSIRRASHLMAWWKCQRAHEWEIEISQRTRKISPNKCPICRKINQKQN